MAATQDTDGMGDSSIDGLIGELADDFVARKQRGEDPTLDEYCARYPQLGKRIREIFPMLLMLEDTKPDDPEPAAPELEEIAGYRIVRRIAYGGMGVVYEAEQESLSRRVALKVLSSRLAKDDAALLRFQREARAAAQLHHTNIVPVFEVGEQDGHLFYAMQLILGQGLDELVQKFQGAAQAQHPSSTGIPLAAEQFMALALRAPSDPSGARAHHTEYYRAVARIGLQVAEAIAYAHARGIVHRDIKPSNLLLDESHVVWITDFGLAKTDDDNLTQTDQFLGTLRYMSPERFRGECDTRADIYALGLTLYELLTLQPAYESRDRLELIDLIHATDPPRPSELNERVPRDLETIVLKSIEKEPRQRYASAADLAEDLRLFLEDEPIKARRITKAERLLRWSRRNKGLAAALAGVLVLLTLITTGASVGSYRVYQLRERALLARRESESRYAELRQNLYLSNMNQAGSSASEPSGFARVAELTSAWSPQNAGVDLRGWEWFYLRSVLGGKEQILRGHTGRVEAVTWSPDRKYLASASDDGTVRVWEFGNNSPPVVLDHPQGVTCVAWSPNGGLLATGCRGGKVRVWDTVAWQEQGSWTIHEGAVRGVGWSPGGGRILSVGADGNTCLWNVGTGAPVEPFLSGAGSVCAAAWSPDGTYVVVGTSSGQIDLWGTNASEIVRTVGEHRGLRSLCWSPDGSQIASTGSDGELRVWSVSAGEEASFGSTLGVLRADWSYDSNWLVSVSGNEAIEIWDPQDGLQTPLFQGRVPDVVCATFDPDAKWLATGSADHLVRIRALLATEPSAIAAHDGETQAISWSPDGARAASSGTDGTIKVWNVAGGTIESEITLSAAADRVAWSPDGSWLLATLPHAVNVWRADTLEQVFQRKVGNQDQSIATDGKVTAAWSPNSERLAVYSRPGYIDLLDTKTWAPRKTVPFPRQPAEAPLAWSPDGRFLAGGSDWICLWDLKGDNVPMEFFAGVGVRLIAWGPDSQRLVTVRRDRDALVWDATTCRRLLNLRGHGLRVTGVSWKPDGTRLVSSSMDGTLKIWDVRSGRETLTLEAVDALTSVGWGPQGRRIISGSVAGKIQFWDATNGYQRNGPSGRFP